MSAKKLLNLSAISELPLMSISTFILLGKGDLTFLLPVTFQIIFHMRFTPTLIFQKLTFQSNLSEMFLSFSKRFLQCLYIFSEAYVHFFKNFWYNSSFLFDIWIPSVIHGLKKDLVLLIFWISGKQVLYAIEDILINLF